MKNKVNEKERVLMFFDSGKFDVLVNETEVIKELLSEIFKEFTSLTNKPVDVSSIGALFGVNPDSSVLAFKQLMFDVITGDQEIKLFGLDVNKEKAIDMIVMPDFSRLRELIVNFIENSKNCSSVSLSDYYVDDSIVLLKDGIVDQLRERCSVYAESEHEKLRFKYFTEIKETLNKMVTEGLIHNINADFSLSYCFPLKGGRYRSSIEFALNHHIAKSGSLADCKQDFISNNW